MFSPLDRDIAGKKGRAALGAPFFLFVEGGQVFRKKKKKKTKREKEKHGAHDKTERLDREILVFRKIQSTDLGGNPAGVLRLLRIFFGFSFARS